MGQTAASQACKRDAALLVRIAGGDRAAFAELIRHHQDRVVNFVFQMVGDWDTALDVAQDTFLRIHARAETFRPEGNARSWILTIAINLAKDQLRRRQRILYLDRVEKAEPDALSHRSGTIPPDLLEARELRRNVARALEGLSLGPRTIMLLRDFEGLSYEELAQILDCEIGTVKSRLHRARKQFEECFCRIDNPRKEP